MRLAATVTRRGAAHCMFRRSLRACECRRAMLPTSPPGADFQHRAKRAPGAVLVVAVAARRARATGRDASHQRRGDWPPGRLHPGWRRRRSGTTHPSSRQLRACHGLLPSTACTAASRRWLLAARQPSLCTTRAALDRQAAARGALHRAQRRRRAHAHLGKRSRSRALMRNTASYAREVRDAGSFCLARF